MLLQGSRHETHSGEEKLLSPAAEESSGLPQSVSGWAQSPTGKLSPGEAATLRSI